MSIFEKYSKGGAYTLSNVSAGILNQNSRKITENQSVNFKNCQDKTINIIEQRVSEVIPDPENQDDSDISIQHLELNRVKSLGVKFDLQKLSIIDSLNFEKMKIKGRKSRGKMLFSSLGINNSGMFSPNRQSILDIYYKFSRPLHFFNLDISLGIGIGHMNKLFSDVKDVQISIDHINGLLIKDSSILKKISVAYLTIPFRIQRKVIRNFSIGTGAGLIIPVYGKSDYSSYRFITPLIRPTSIDSLVDYSNQTVEITERKSLIYYDFSLGYSLKKWQINFGMKLLLNAKNNFSQPSNSISKINETVFSLSFEYCF